MSIQQIVYVAGDQYDTAIYASALRVLADHLEYQYYDDDEALLERVNKVLQDKDERAAWEILDARKDYEYERVRQTTVIK